MIEYLQYEEQEPRDIIGITSHMNRMTLLVGKTDSELKNSVLERLRLNCGGIPLDSIAISVEANKLRVYCRPRGFFEFRFKRRAVVTDNYLRFEEGITG